MDLSKLTLFNMAKTRMDWAAQRQRVIAQNVANANTPGYRASDLRQLDFKDLAAAKSNSLELARTDVRHVASASPGPFKEVRDQYPFESSPDGNEVVLEEQMSLMAETKDQYSVSLEIVKKHLAMIKMVTRGSR